MFKFIQSLICPTSPSYTAERIQVERDEAEINVACWTLRLKHRDRDLAAAQKKANSSGN